MCLNPELKLEALAKHLNESSYTYRNGIQATKINLHTDFKNWRD